MHTEIILPATELKTATAISDSAEEQRRCSQEQTAEAPESPPDSSPVAEEDNSTDFVAFPTSLQAEEPIGELGEEIQAESVRETTVQQIQRSLTEVLVLLNEIGELLDRLEQEMHEP